MQPLNTPEAVSLVLPIIEVLERLGVAYRIGGSVASSYYGQPRATHDIDLIAEMEMAHVDPFVRALDARDYLVFSEAITDAIIYRSSFSVIERHSMYKVDIFIAKATLSPRRPRSPGKNNSVHAR